LIKGLKVNSFWRSKLYFYLSVFILIYLFLYYYKSLSTTFVITFLCDTSSLDALLIYGLKGYWTFCFSASIFLFFFFYYITFYNLLYKGSKSNFYLFNNLYLSVFCNLIFSLNWSISIFYLSLYWIYLSSCSILLFFAYSWSLSNIFYLLSANYSNYLICGLKVYCFNLFYYYKIFFYVLYKFLSLVSWIRFYHWSFLDLL